MVQSGILHALHLALQHKESPLRKEACYTLSNMLLEKTEGHDTVIDNKIMPHVLDIMKNDLPEVIYSLALSYI